MDTKHTPGPWRAGSGTGGKGSVVCNQLAAGALSGSDAVEYYGGNLIAESVAQENIPLIAAAPELLEALRDLDECYCEAGQQLSREDRHRHRMTLIKARAAIAKATGIAA